MPKILAQILTVFFHPLLIATYMLVLLLLLNPYLFGVGNIAGQFSLIMILFFSTFFMPMVMILMLKQLDFISSLKLENREERIAPFIFAGFFYISMTVFFIYHHPDVPNAFSAFLLGATIALFASFLLNLFIPISTHAVGMGALLGMVFTTIWQFSHGLVFINLGSWGVLQINAILIFILISLLTGLVGSARMKLRHYTLQEMYGSYLIGFFAQIVALRIFF